MVSRDIIEKTDIFNNTFSYKGIHIDKFINFNYFSQNTKRIKTHITFEITP